MSSVPSKTTGLTFSLRLSLFYAACFIAGYVVIFTAADLLIRNSIEDKEREIVSERLTEYRAWFLSDQLPNLRVRFIEQSRRSADLMFVRLTGPGTEALMFCSPKGHELMDVRLLNELAASDDPVIATIVTSNPRNVWTVASTRVGNGLVLQAGRISTPAFEALATFRRMFLLTIIPGALVALVGGAFLSYRAMKPARDLTATVAGIVETGKLDRRVEVTPSRCDLAEMGVLFNRMLDRNQRLIRGMRESLDNVAHDLRTPMARMRASAEGALAADDDPAAATEALADCMEESDRVLTMLHTLMDIAEAETGAMHLQRERLDLVTLIGQVIELYELVAEERRVTIESELPDSLEVEGDHVRLQQAVANLMDNAIKYGSEGGRVRVSAAGEDASVVIRVVDDGIGIPGQDLPRVWERLYRGDQSRAKRGLGLGLSFVKAIVDAHGGTASVTSRPGEGSQFELRLPKA